MDSGSGSMQSSSGGEDQEYDSQPVLLNNIINPHTNFSSFLPNNYKSHQSNTIFDLPASNYNLRPFSHSQPNISNSNINNPLINLNMLNPGSTLRSQLPNLLMAGTSIDQFLLPAADQAGQNQGFFPGPSSTTVQQRNISSEQPVRNSKKRTRASRRAPTTVLTTDTSNFRAMVQEFTGIPAPPFSAGSSYSRRLDLFSSAGSSLRSGHLEPIGGGGGLYPLRPNSAQKVQPFLSHYSNGNSNTPNSLLNNNNMVYSNNFTNPILDRLGLMTKDQSSQNMANMQFQQPDHFGSKSQVNDGQLCMSSFDQELGTSPGNHVDANLSIGARSIHVEREDPEANCLRSLEGNFGSSSSRVDNSTCKLNFTGSRSDFHDHHEKGLMDQNNAVSTSRGGGTVESWICPSD